MKSIIIRNVYILIFVLCALILLPGLVSAEEESPSDTEPDKTIKERIQWIGKGLSLHKQNYLLPLTWGNNDSTLEDAELKFQISFKQQIFDTNFYVAYTQKSFWRWLDDEDSRPFRETNYNPEIFYRLEKEYPSGRWGGDAGYEHESNGSSQPTSRSWDRFYIAPFCEYKKFRADMKIWYRIPEDDKENEGDSSGDDNPDIEDYYGYAELKLRYERQNKQMLSLIGRWNPNTHNSGWQFDYSIPTPDKNAFFFFQLWTGYGESLIDYNHYITSFGFGIMLKR